MEHTTESPDTSILFPEKVAINPQKLLLTKSQLTDLWNKANKKSILPSKIHRQDLDTMSDFTDYVAGEYKPINPQALELDATRIIEKDRKSVV